jgi:hypothetical protein
MRFLRAFAFPVFVVRRFLFVISTLLMSATRYIIQGFIPDLVNVHPKCKCLWEGGFVATIAVLQKTEIATPVVQQFNRT